VADKYSYSFYTQEDTTKAAYLKEVMEETSVRGKTENRDHLTTRRARLLQR